MFTGLIQSVGVVRDLRPAPTGLRLMLDPAPWDHRPALGDSISVSGVCLTLAGIEQGLWAFDVVHETLTKTTLGTLRPGARVNLEHACLPTTLLGGHIVQGHVDGVGTVTHVQRGDDWRLTLAPPAELMPFMAPKGSVCLQGVSLTIAQITRESLSVALIPVTLEKTTLGGLEPGDGVNIEADVLAKTVVNYLRHWAT